MSEMITEKDAAAQKARSHPTHDAALPPGQHGFSETSPVCRRRWTI